MSLIFTLEVRMSAFLLALQTIIWNVTLQWPRPRHLCPVLASKGRRNETYWAVPLVWQLQPHFDGASCISLSTGYKSEVTVFGWLSKGDSSPLLEAAHRCCTAFPAQWGGGFFKVNGKRLLRLQVSVTSPISVI